MKSLEDKTENSNIIKIVSGTNWQDSKKKTEKLSLFLMESGSKVKLLIEKTENCKEIFQLMKSSWRHFELSLRKKKEKVWAFKSMLVENIRNIKIV